VHLVGFIIRVTVEVSSETSATLYRAQRDHSPIRQNPVCTAAYFPNLTEFSRILLCGLTHRPMQKKKFCLGN